MPGLFKGNGPKVAIGGLVLLNLVLIVTLVLRDPPDAITAMPAASEGSTSATRTSSSPTPSTTARSRTPTPTSTPSTAAPPSTPAPTPTQSATGADQSTRILAVSSETVAWRAVFGPCPTDPEVEVSQDGGRTWRRTKPELRSVSRLRAFGASAVFAIGGAESCRPRFVASGGPREPWITNEAELGQTWYRVPKHTDRVHAPGGQVSNPCDKRLMDFAGLGDYGAAALCAGGTLRTTRDNGRTWRDLKGGSAGLALGADEQTYAVAMQLERCKGIAVVVLDPDARSVDRDAVRCAPLTREAGEELAVGVRGEVVWLWLGDQVVVSTDRGRSWERPAGV